MGLLKETVGYKQSLSFLNQQTIIIKEQMLLNRRTGSMLLLFFAIGIILIIAGYVKHDQDLITSGFVMSLLVGVGAGLFVIHDILADKLNKRLEDEEDDL